MVCFFLGGGGWFISRTCGKMIPRPLACGAWITMLRGTDPVCLPHVPACQCSRGAPSRGDPVDPVWLCSRGAPPGGGGSPAQCGCAPGARLPGNPASPVPSLGPQEMIPGAPATVPVSRRPGLRPRSSLPGRPCGGRGGHRERRGCGRRAPLARSCGLGGSVGQGFRTRRKDVRVQAGSAGPRRR